MQDLMSWDFHIGSIHLTGTRKLFIKENHKGQKEAQGCPPGKSKAHVIPILTHAPHQEMQGGLQWGVWEISYVTYKAFISKAATIYGVKMV